MLISVVEPSGRCSSALPLAIMAHTLDKDMVLLSVDPSEPDSESEPPCVWGYAYGRKVGFGKRDASQPCITAASCRLRFRPHSSQCPTVRLVMTIFRADGRLLKDNGEMDLTCTLHAATTRDVCRTEALDSETKISDHKLVKSSDGIYSLHVRCPEVTSDLACYTAVLRVNGLKVFDLPVTIRVMDMHPEPHPHVRFGSLSPGVLSGPVLSPSDAERLWRQLPASTWSDGSDATPESLVAVLLGDDHADDHGDDEPESGRESRPSSAQPPSSASVSDVDTDDAPFPKVEVHYSYQGSAIDTAMSDAVYTDVASGLRWRHLGSAPPPPPENAPPGRDLSDLCPKLVELFEAATAIKQARSRPNHHRAAPKQRQPTARAELRLKPEQWQQCGSLQFEVGSLGFDDYGHAHMHIYTYIRHPVHICIHT